MEGIRVRPLPLIGQHSVLVVKETRGAEPPAGVHHHCVKGSCKEDMGVDPPSGAMIVKVQPVLR